MTIADAAHVDGPPEAIAADAVHGEGQLASIADANPGADQRIFNVHGGKGQLASIADANPGACQRIFNARGGRGPFRPRGGGRRRGDHASKGPPAPVSHIAGAHLGVAKKRLLAVERQTAPY